MTDWTPEEDEAFNEVEKHSNLGKQILREMGQPYHYEPKYVAFMDVPHRPWVGLTDEERIMCRSYDPEEAVAKTEAKLKEKNT